MKREPIKLTNARIAHENGTETSEEIDSSHALLEGLSAPPGKNFFRILSRSLAVALNTRFAFVTEVTEEPGFFKVLALWTGEGFGENFTYQMRGTPCERILGKDIVSINKDVQHVYPNDTWVSQMGAESYIAVPLLGSDGSALGHMGVLHDAPIGPSEEKAAVLRAFARRAAGELQQEHERAASHQKLDALEAVVNAPLGILQLDREGKISLANRKLEAMFGYEHAELLGWPVEQLLPVKSRRRHAEHRTLFARDPHERSMGADLDIRGRRKDGSTFPVTVSLSASGGLTTAFVVDATTVKQASDIMERNQERLEAVVQAYPEMTFIVDRNGVVVDFVSSGLEPHVPPEEMLGKSFPEFLPEKEVAQQLLCSVKLALKTHRVHRLRCDLTWDDGTHSIETRFVRLDSNRVALFVRDFTAEEWLIDDKPIQIEKMAQHAEPNNGEPNKEWRNPYRLSYREFSVLHLLKDGTTDKEIANELGISVFTVNKHVSNILMKMDAASRTEATIRALQEGLIE